VTRDEEGKGPSSAYNIMHSHTQPLSLDSISCDVMSCGIYGARATTTVGNRRSQHELNDFPSQNSICVRVPHMRIALGRRRLSTFGRHSILTSTTARIAVRNLQQQHIGQPAIASKSRFFLTSTRSTMSSSTQDVHMGGKAHIIDGTAIAKSVLYQKAPQMHRADCTTGPSGPKSPNPSRTSNPPTRPSNPLTCSSSSSAPMQRPEHTSA